MHGSTIIRQALNVSCGETERGQILVCDNFVLPDNLFGRFFSVVDVVVELELLYQ